MEVLVQAEDLLQEDQEAEEAQLEHFVALAVEAAPVVGLAATAIGLLLCSKQLSFLVQILLRILRPRNSFQKLVHSPSTGEILA